MSLTASAIRLMAEMGLNALQIADIAEANDCGDAVAEKRRAFDRERKRLAKLSTGIPPEFTT